jgi:hypothetical protein
MTRTRRIAVNARIALLPLIILACACSAEAPASTVTGPMDAAVAQAAEAGRNVLVLYTKEGCACSSIMDETLADPEVEEALGKTVFLRMTKGLNAETFESRWADAEAPSFVVLGADGKAKGEPMKGPFEAGEFLFFLDWVATPEGPQPELVRIEDGCGGCGDKDNKEETEADAAGGCGGCGDDATKVVAPKTDDGCGGCTGE